MPAGFQVFDPNSGALRLDYTDRMFKFLGVAQVGQSYTGNASAGEFQNPLFNAYPGNVPFAFMLGGKIEIRGYACQFRFEGSTCYWWFAQSNGDPAAPWTRPDTVFAYGIY